MKRIILLIGLFLGLFSGIVRAQEENANNIGVVKANGAAVINSGEKEAYQRALLVARRNSAEKALLRFIPANFEKDSLYLQLLSKYDTFVGRDVKVYKAQKLNGKLLLFCEVPVNFQRIQQEIKQSVAREQSQNRKDKVVFLVKLDNYPEEFVGNLEQHCRMTFEDAVREYNFRSLGMDSAGPQVLALLQNHTEIYSFEEYREKLLSLLKEQPEINLVLVGTIEVKRLDNYVPNYYAEVEGHFELLKLDGNRVEVLGEVKEGFTALRTERGKALEDVTQAAAVKISKKLASMTFNYWNSK